MAPRPSSPTSLLWAHQLKREHGYLLKRMQGLESASDRHEVRIKTAETAAKSSAGGELEALAKEVKALDHTLHEGLNGMEKDVTQKLDDVQAENEAMTMQIAALQKDEKVAEDERKKDLAKDKALLQRIGEVEEGLKKYEESLGRIGRRINETQFDSIMERLENLTKRVTEEGSQMKMVTESVRVLETAYAEISKRNAQLEGEVKKKASTTPLSSAREIEEPTVEGATEDSTAPPDNADKSRKKKSHKWGGGGADRDIIRQGSSLLGDSPIVVHHPPQKKSSAPQKSTAVSKKPPVPKKKKPAVPKAPAPDSNRKSHKWAGGGADRDIIAQGLTSDSITTVKRERSEETPVIVAKKRASLPASRPVGKDTPVVQAKSKPLASTSGVVGKNKPVVPAKPKPVPLTTGLVGKQRVVRAGKGWIEVSRTPSPESQESSVPSKRGRGRPRKYPKQASPAASTVAHDIGQPMKRARGRPRKSAISIDSESELQPVAGTATRRTIQQEDHHLTSKKRTADEAFESLGEEAPGVMFKKPEAVDEQSSQGFSTPDSVRHRPNIYSSPVSSSPPACAGAEAPAQDSTDFIGGVITSQPESTAPKRRREIVQLNDDISEIVRHMSG